MGAVLKFPLEKVSRTSSRAAEDERSAEILLFEGVRYDSATSKLVFDKDTKLDPVENL